jgi:DnaJ-class molecular chaperone
MTDHNTTETKAKPFREDCTNCMGTGQVAHDCEACEGKGWVDDPEDGGTMECPECGNEQCKECEA